MNTFPPDPRRVSDELHRAVRGVADVPGRFERIERAYRRRRAERAAVGVTTAILLLGAGAYAGVTLSGGGATSSLRVAGGATPSLPPSAAPSVAPATPTPPASPATPTGGPFGTFQPASATFVSPQQGWALGSQACASCVLVLHTTDGGRSWRKLAPPPFPLAAAEQITPGDGVSAIRFANAEVGYAFGPALWVTRDGGSHWQRDTTFGARRDQAVDQVRYLETAGGTTYAVVHTGEGNGCTELEATPISTERWTTVPNVGGCGAGLGVSSLALTGRSGWLLLDMAVSSYYRLTPAGWVRSTLPCPGDAGADAVAATPDGRTVAIGCLGGAAAGSARRDIYLSNDGGVSFHQIFGGLTVGDGFLLTMNSQRLIGATASGASYLTVEPLGPGAPRPVLTVNDGGAGWRDLGLTSSQQGFAIEDSSGESHVMYMTHDGGLHWGQVAF